MERRRELGRGERVLPGLWRLRRYAERLSDRPSGIERVIEPDRPLIGGVEIETDLGTWTVHETPGHAPSHVCFYQRERRLLLSGDHVLGRVSLYYDYGWTPDPVGEFLHSLGVVDRLDARLGLSGHGKPFVDVRGHVAGSRRLVEQRLGALLSGLDGSSRTPLE